MEKVTSFADERDSLAIATDMFAKDKNLDTTRFPDIATLQVFIEDATQVTQAFGSIAGAVVAADRARIVKFA